MDSLNLTPIEAQLLQGAANEAHLKRYRITVSITTILFACLLIAASYLFAERPRIIVILTGCYALLNFIEILRFSRVIRNYRTLLEKLVDALFSRTQQEEYKKRLELTALIKRYERSLLFWSAALSIAICALLLRPLTVFSQALMILVYIIGIMTIRYDLIAKLLRYKGYAVDYEEELNNLSPTEKSESGAEAGPCKTK